MDTPRLAAGEDERSEFLMRGSPRGITPIIMFSMRMFFAVVFSFAVASILFPSSASAPVGGQFDYAEEKPIPARERSVKMLFAGDMMFDRSVRKVIYEKGGDFIFSCIGDVLNDADLVVANLEGPITALPSVSEDSIPGGKHNYTFTFPASTARLLAAHNIKIVNLGNNHILNFGWDGARSTLKVLEKEGIGYFGDPISQHAATSTINGVAFAFINYNEFALSPHPNKLEFVSMLSNTVGQIQAARAAAEIPIVYAHWGVEYATTSSAYSRELAHSFIDAGAEIVIGSHPHVIEDHEIYQGKHIYYSLGNFILDQYFSEDVRRGLLLKVIFDQSGVQSVEEIPVHLESDRRTCPIRNS